jgi:hypothetical protein
MTMTLFATWVLAGFPMDVFERPEAFTVLETSGGVTVSSRAVPGSVFQEYRVQRTAPYPPAALCPFIYEWGTRAGDGPGIVHHQLLVDGETERIIYQQISQPVVSRRDFTFTSLYFPAEKGPCRVRFRLTNEKGPPKPEGFVRLQKLWGEWVVEPHEKGSLVTYTLFSDPGGSIPAFLVHGPARDSTKNAVVTMLDRAAKAKLPAAP